MKKLYFIDIDELYPVYNIDGPVVNVRGSQVAELTDEEYARIRVAHKEFTAVNALLRERTNYKTNTQLNELLKEQTG